MAERFTEQIGQPQAAPKASLDPNMIFLRGFYGSPERQRVEEYLREQRDTASRNKVSAIDKDNRTAATFYDGCQYGFDGLLAWLRSCDPTSAE